MNLDNPREIDAVVERVLAQTQRPAVAMSDRSRSSIEPCADKEACEARVLARALRGKVPHGRVRTAADLAPFIDHTVLGAEATRVDVVRAVEEARQYGFAAVRTFSSWTATVADALAGCCTVPIAVVGFPSGAVVTKAKAEEARAAIGQGAREIETVIHRGALRSREYAWVHDDLATVVEAARPYPVSVILETSQLTPEEKVAAAALARAAGAAQVNTSSGAFATTVADIALLRQVIGDFLGVGVKASADDLSTADAMRLLRAGASRLVTPASVAVVTGRLSVAD